MKKYVLKGNLIFGLENNFTSQNMVSAFSSHIPTTIVELDDNVEVTLGRSFYDKVTKKVYNFDIQSQRDFIKALANRAISIASKPIKYNNIMWDADETAYKNILNTISSVEVAGVTLPSDFVWRDHDNNLQPITIDDLKQLSQLIFDRTFEARKLSWEIKSSTFHSDTNQGWIDEAVRIGMLINSL